MKKFVSYLKADWKRLLCPGKLLLSIACMTGILLLAMLEGIDLNTDVLYVFSLTMYGAPALMILVCAALAFAGSFCEDMEHKYVMQQMIRGNVGAYVSARVCSVFLSAMLGTVAGILLFVNILHLRLPWTDALSQQYDHLLRSGGLKLFLRSRRFELYFLCYAVQYGLLTGILSLWASYLSMYISNQMLVLATPMVLYYVVDYLLNGLFHGMVNLGLIFSASNNLFSQDYFAVLFAAALGIGNVVLLGLLMARKLRRKIYE